MLGDSVTHHAVTLSKPTYMNSTA